MTLKERYFSETPELAKKIGDGILLIATTLSASVMSLPLTDNQIKWTVFALSLVGAIGKTVTNFFTFDPPTNPPA